MRVALTGPAGLDRLDEVTIAILDEAGVNRWAQSTATLARLICPRRLEPSAAYRAALVPATLQGAQAALGGDVTDGLLQPAWTAATGYLQLPVFYSWTFTTGPAGDFESLVSRLRRVRLDAAAVAGRPLDLTELHALTGAGPADATTLLPGALGGDQDGPPAVDPALAASLGALLDLAAPDPASTPGAAELPLSLPTYGRWHAALRGPPLVGGTGWPAQLNLHPAARAVAAVGARIVQSLQEELMTAAWQQAGQVAAANQLLRQAQLARGGSAAGHARLASMPATTAVAVTSAVHGRVLDVTAPPASPATVLATGGCGRSCTHGGPEADRRRRPWRAPTRQPRPPRTPGSPGMSPARRLLGGHRRAGKRSPWTTTSAWPPGPGPTPGRPARPS
jgi:hypothetical protein